MPDRAPRRLDHGRHLPARRRPRPGHLRRQDALVPVGGRAARARPPPTTGDAQATLLDVARLGIRAGPTDGREPSTYAPPRPPSSSLFARPEGASRDGRRYASSDGLVRGQPHSLPVELTESAE